MAAAYTDPTVRQQGTVAYAPPTPRTSTPAPNMGGMPALSLPRQASRPVAQPAPAKADVGRPTEGGYGVGGSAASGGKAGRTPGAGSGATIFGVPAFKIGDPGSFFMPNEAPQPAVTPQPGTVTGQPAARPERERGVTPGQRTQAGYTQTPRGGYNSRLGGPEANIVGHRQYDGEPVDQAERRAYRAQFAADSAHTQREEMENAAIYAAIRANPSILNNDAAFARVLNDLGIYNEKERGQSRFRSLDMARKGEHILGSNLQPVDGGFADVATRDVNPDSPTARGVVQRGTGLRVDSLEDQLAATLGFDRFGQWVERGETGMEGVDPVLGLYYNTNPDGSRSYFNEQGFSIDPESGAVTGHYMLPGSGGQWASRWGGWGRVSGRGRLPQPPPPQTVTHPPPGSLPPPAPGPYKGSSADWDTRINEGAQVGTQAGSGYPSATAQRGSYGPRLSGFTPTLVPGYPTFNPWTGAFV